jgi:predicted DNA-binding protein
MELDKKTTILFPEELHQRLSRLATYRGTSLGSLVREACVSVYGLVDADTRLEAVGTLRELSLPVGTPDAMKRESVPAADTLMP